MASRADDTATPVLRLPQNTAGRDFVAGDVHGCLPLLLEGLKRVSFDPSVDRLLLAGDLVDRGEDSAGCLRLLRSKGVYSVRGNHEDMALEAFDEEGELVLEPRALESFLRNGMGWWLQQTSRERRQLLALARSLPLVIEVPTRRGLVGIVHADVPAEQSWSQFVAAIEHGDERTCEIALWGRKRIQGQNDRGVAGVGRVFVGHTPQWGQMRRFGNVYAVDTGAVYGQSGDEPQGALSVMNVLTTTVATLRAPAPGPLLLLDEPEASNRPFGQGPGYLASGTSRWAWPRRA